jgi:hypothetical protein
MNGHGYTTRRREATRRGVRSRGQIPRVCDQRRGRYCVGLIHAGAKMIRHTVVFRLKHAKGSAAEQSFLANAVSLASIPGVENFEQLQQVSRKNDYDFGFSMEFADQAAYDGYNVHPDHVAFVRDHWVPEVEAFLEIDYVPLGQDA